MSDFETFMQRHEMGLAYKKITEEMGPSPQLVAFVNMAGGDDSVGLESLDVDSSHQQILNELEGDPFLDLACESLIGRIKSGSERFKNMITLNKHSQDIARFGHGNIHSRDSNITTISHDHFLKYVTVHAGTIPLFKYILNKAPRTHDVKEWEHFWLQISTIGSATEFDKKWQEVKELNSKLFSNEFWSTMDFNQAGWTVDNFKSAVETFLSQVKLTTNDLTVSDAILVDMAKLIDDNDDRTEIKMKTLSKDKDADGKVTATNMATQTIKYGKVSDAWRAMDKTYDFIFDLNVLCNHSITKMHKALMNISHHFDVA